MEVREALDVGVVLRVPGTEAELLAEGDNEDDRLLVDDFVDGTDMLDVLLNIAVFDTLRVGIHDKLLVGDVENEDDCEGTRDILSDGDCEADLLLDVNGVGEGEVDTELETVGDAVYEPVVLCESDLAVESDFVWDSTTDVEWLIDGSYDRLLLLVSDADVDGEGDRVIEWLIDIACEGDRDTERLPDSLGGCEVDFEGESLFEKVSVTEYDSDALGFVGVAGFVNV
jgi:hypothetical protein